MWNTKNYPRCRKKKKKGYGSSRVLFTALLYKQQQTERKMVKSGDGLVLARAPNLGSV